MTALAPSGEQIVLDGSTISRGRKFRNFMATAAMGVAVLLAAIPLGFVLYQLVAKGAEMIRVDWFTEDIPTNVGAAALAEKFGAEPEEVIYGMAPAIVGTFLMTAMASLLAIPIGLLGAVYLNEYGKNGRLAGVIRFFTDVMTGVPSVIMGIFIYTFWVLRYGPTGRSAIAGSLALACLMLPIVVRSCEEMLRLVPDALREGSAALGSPRWRTTTTVVLPAALPGITSGCMLAIARAAGETAPLLFTIGSVTAVNFSLQGQNTALSTQIYSNATQPGGEPLAWGAALTLVVIVLVFTMAGRRVAKRFSIDAAA
ncbi:MAG TPA: phosphate ABC transporter permease PstA [Microthrixaceae bacterium]|nr:phosphate ABC transporter permease PstA [Microthrixaceae bacterium]